MTSDHYHREKYSFRILNITAKEVYSFKKIFNNFSYKVNKYFKDKEKFVISTEVIENIDCGKLKEFIKKNNLPKESYGIYASLVTGTDSDGLTVPDRIIDFYAKIGGTIDFSFTFIEDDEE
jgi:hypothetical protein